MIFVVMLLGATTILGQFGEADAESNLELNTDGDLAIDTDIDADLDVGGDLDMDIAAEVDTDIDIDTDVSLESDVGIETHISSIHPGTAHITHGSDATIIDANEIKSEKARPGLGFILFATLIKTLNPGKVPLSMLLSALLTIWGVSGLIINYIIYSIIGSYPLENLVFTVVLAISLIISIPFVRGSSNVFGKIFENKSYHSSKEDYIGLTATVSSPKIPTIQEINSGQVIGVLNFIDRHGHKMKLYGFIPDNCKTIPKYKDTVVLIDYLPERRLYKVLVEDSNEHLRWAKVDYKYSSKS
jgi:hypothetical protein